MKVGEIKRLSNKTRAWLQIYYGEKQERNDLKQEPLKRDIWICLPSTHKHHPRMDREREENHTCEWSSPTRSIKTQQSIPLFTCLASHLTLFVTASSPWEKSPQLMLFCLPPLPQQATPAFLLLSSASTESQPPTCSCTSMPREGIKPFFRGSPTP